MFNNKENFIFKIIILIVTVCLVAGVIVAIEIQASARAAEGKQYIWLFKDYLKNGNKVPTYLHPIKIYISNPQLPNLFYCEGKERFFYMDRQNKVFNNIYIKELKGVKSIDLNKIVFKHSVLPNNLSTLSREDFKTDKDILNLNIDKSSKINRFFSGSNYTGFYGVVYKMTVSNEKNEHVMMFDNTNLPITKEAFGKEFPLRDFESQILVLLYKKDQILYVIIIDSLGSPFKDTGILDLFNLT